MRKLQIVIDEDVLRKETKVLRDFLNYSAIEITMVVYERPTIDSAKNLEIKYEEFKNVRWFRFSGKIPVIGNYDLYILSLEQLPRAKELVKSNLNTEIFIVTVEDEPEPMERIRYRTWQTISEFIRLKIKPEKAEKVKNRKEKPVKEVEKEMESSGDSYNKDDFENTYEPEP